MADCPRAPRRERALSAADEDGEGVGGTKQRRKKQPTEDGSLAALETRKVKRRRKRLVSTELEKLKSERTLFVGNLPFEYSKEVRGGFFSDPPAVQCTSQEVECLIDHR